MNFPENSSRATELGADRLSKINYDDLWRRPEAQSNEYFVQDIGAFYNEANVYSETNQQLVIDNNKLECESLAAGNVRPNVWTTHLNCDARHSLVHTARPNFDGKRFYVFFFVRNLLHSPKNRKRMR